ncbi:MAG TPA: hypothetical protein VEU97_10740 [Ktedonobacteraceae bacterium]|nr:hypothetical protein [Ktedonobacteraceae bacterium]
MGWGLEPIVRQIYAWGSGTAIKTTSSIGA